MQKAMSAAAWAPIETIQTFRQFMTHSLCYAVTPEDLPAVPPLA